MMQETTNNKEQQREENIFINDCFSHHTYVALNHTSTYLLLHDFQSALYTLSDMGDFLQLVLGAYTRECKVLRTS